MFQHKLQINGAPSPLLSTTKGRTTMTNVLYTNLKLKLPSMGRQKFVVPQLLCWWLVFDLLSLNTAFYYFYSMEEVLIASHFPRMCSHLWSSRSAQKLQLNSLLSNGSFNHSVKWWILFSHILCKIWYTRTVISSQTPYDALCTFYWLFVRTALDWVARVRCHWLRTSRYMSRHAQEVPSE
jgi:hypothetical protein